MDPTERALALLGLLQAQREWTAEELGECLGVTTRTVRRDVVRLRSYGYRIAALAGHGGGYRLDAGRALPPLLLGDEEALAVALGVRFVAAAGVADLAGAVPGVIAKIEQFLPPRLRSRLEAIDSVTVADPSGAPTDRHLFAELARAAAGRLRVRFTYVDQAGAASSRNAEPHGLVRARSHWYLAAFDLDRDDWRTFRTDRITDLETTSRHFEPRPGPTPEELVTRGIPPEQFAHRAVLLLDLPAAAAAARIPTTIGSVTAHGAGRSRVEIGTDDLRWLAHYVVGLEIPFEVIEPDELRLELRRLARRIAASAVTPG